MSKFVFTSESKYDANSQGGGWEALSSTTGLANPPDVNVLDSNGVSHTITNVTVIVTD